MQIFRQSIRVSLFRRGAAFLLPYLILLSILLSPVAVLAAVALDAHEPDDTAASAYPILLNDQNPAHMQMPGYDWQQFHNFHQANDQDWAIYYAHAREVVYKIEVLSPGPNCDAVIDVFSADDLNNPIQTMNDRPAGEAEYLDWVVHTDGLYYIRIRSYDGAVFGEGTGYKLVLSIPVGTFIGFVRGTVVPPVRTTILTDGGGEAVSLPNGFFAMPHLAGTGFLLTAQADGYPLHSQRIDVSEFGSTELSVTLGYGPTGGFDAPAYLAANPDLPRSWGKTECIAHYTQFGFKEKRAVSFEVSEYLAANSDLPVSWGRAEALNHYNLFGRNENRLIAFDPIEYGTLYGDLPEDWSYEVALSHYTAYGRAEGRVASFDHVAYLDMYSDLPRTWTQAEAFSHYWHFGRFEGRAYDAYDETVFETLISGTTFADTQ